MRLNIIILFYFCSFIVSITCYNFKIHDSSSKDSTKRLSSHARKLAEMCFTNNSNPLIITADLVDDSEVQNPYDFDAKNPMIVIDGNFKSEKMTGLIPSYPTYVLSFESIEKLGILIKEFKSSKIWSITSPFLILETNEESGCANAGNILKFLWKYDLLSAYYLCYQKDLSFVYTFNPFTKYAPLPWEEIETAEKFIGNKSTLYSLRYSEDQKVCKNLTFDKTQYLDGHQIKASAFGVIKNDTAQGKIHALNKHMNKTLGAKIVDIYSLLSHINATWKTDFFPSSMARNANNRGYIELLVNNEYDMGDQLRQLADTNPEFTDIITAYREVKFSIITKKTNYSTAISELAYNPQFLVLCLVVLILISVVIIINNKFDVRRGIMDVVRISASMGILSPIDRLSMRIVFFTGFLFVFTVMPEFQGQITAVLSKPMRRNVDTLQDLYEHKYHVYFDGILHNDMMSQKLWETDEDKEYLHSSNFTVIKECYKEALKDPTVACIYNTNSLVYRALQFNELHLSRKIVFKKYLVYWTRKNWALKSKLDGVGLIPLEMGFNKYRDDKKIRERIDKLKKKDKINEDTNYGQIDLDNFVFAYIFTGSVFLLGIVIFGMEILFSKWSRLYRQFQLRRRSRARN
ncbi:uncharacterized protein LOC130675150 [Microplitis mediator]|uniref:uncharacterized protein LOC130675150 n=1 Tax=Microplitis mediator TaxID=375433 RepID=UPI002555F7FB|nr:uncharacterized protein LOC130675150 [Microplitis mediator]